MIDPHGYDAGKKIKGKKRHILVDTLGLLLSAVVHAADIQDRDGAASNDILIAVVNGLKGFPEAITMVFPLTQVQTCSVHLIRNSLSFVSWKAASALSV